MAEQHLRDIKLHMIPRPEDLIQKIWEDKATLADFIEYDILLTNYLTELSNFYLTTTEENVKEMYSFLSMLIQQFKDYLPTIAYTRNNVRYRPDQNFAKIEDQNTRSSYTTDMSKYDTQFLYRPDQNFVKVASSSYTYDNTLTKDDSQLLYNWLSTLIDIEETFTCNGQIFKKYKRCMYKALREIIKKF